jgi:hypothetical protein
MQCGSSVVDTSVGEGFLGLCGQHDHMTDFERLRSYELLRTFES